MVANDSFRGINKVMWPFNRMVVVQNPPIVHFLGLEGESEASKY